MAFTARSGSFSNNIWRCDPQTATNTPEPADTQSIQPQQQAVEPTAVSAVIEGSDATATNTPEPTATNTLVPTNTTVPPTNTPIPAASNTAIPESAKRINSVTLLSDQPGVLVVTWNLPSASPGDYRLSWARVGEGFPYFKNPGNVYPTTNSYTITDLEQGARYKVRVRARYDGGGDWSEPVDAEVMAAPVAANTAVPTNTAVPPTNTPVPTNTTVPPTNTPVPVANSRDVSNVQLTSAQLGELTVSWNAPSEAPRDYRVMYARVDENYKSWKDSSGNVFPTGASITLTGLDQGVRYKLKVRARYNGGSGDWSEQYEADIAAS